MIKLFDILPGWIWAALLAAATLTNCHTGSKLQTERLDHQTAKTAYAERVAIAEKQRADEEAKRRKAEQELLHGQETHSQAVAALQLDLDRARSRATVAADGVRNAAADAAQRARAQCADPRPADMGATAGDPIGVLADVLGRADERAGLLADLADRRHLAGRACEREYDRAYKTLSDSALGSPDLDQ